MATLFIIATISLLCFALAYTFRTKVLYRRFFSLVSILTFAELLAALMIYGTQGVWIYDLAKVGVPTIFSNHPHLVATPKPLVKQSFNGFTYSHNSNGWRTANFGPKDSRVRVVAIGGSTTYGTHVNDDETWPFYLQQELGSKYEVINLGIPGHTMAEHVILAALILPDYAPDIVLLHAGLNDLRMLNVDNLSADYANFHPAALAASMGLCFEDHLPFSALLRVAVILLQKIDIYPVCEFKQKEFKFSERESHNSNRAVELYRRHLSTFSKIIEAQSARLIFVPQILLPERVADGSYSWWIPYIPTGEIVDKMKMYNDILATQARSSHSDYLEDVLKYPWHFEDFVDSSHLGPNANKIFAKIIAREIIAH